MGRRTGRPAEERALAQALLKDRSLSVIAIARRLGVSRQTVQRWNARSDIRPLRPQRRTLEAWPQGRREAAARILSVAEIDPGDLAEAAGFSRGTGSLLLAAFGPLGRMAEPGGRGGAADPLRLRTRLRAHVGRQIAALDAALSGKPGAGFDSAKVLRDLGGLKRLLDDLGSDGGEGEGGSRDEPARCPLDAAELDLDGLRAEIARRFDRFVAGGAAD